MSNTPTENIGHTKEEVVNSLDRINFWIGNCDTKISFSLAFAGILLGGFFSSGIITGSLNKLEKKMIHIDNIKHPWEMRLLEGTTLVLLAFIITMIITITYLFKALKGSIDSSVYSQPGLTTDSQIFFGTIANQSFQAFKQKVTTTTESDIHNDYLSQVFINSKICQRKFTLYNKGIQYLIISTVLFVILNIFFLFI
jgi:hypothetical protein